MRRSTRLLAIALPVALATVPVALAGADSASGGGQPAAPSATSGAPTVVKAELRRDVRRNSALAAVAVDVAARVAAVARQRATPAAEIVAVRPGAAVALHERPAGPVALRAGDTTEFGSAQRLGVVRRDGRWLGVTTPDLPNGTLGWIDSSAAGIRVERTRWAIQADISSRTVVLSRAGKPVRRLDVAVGRPGSPTPTGRFAVTDKLPGGDYGPYYGCCILALSATQPNTPPGWTGGNRMAIHGTSDPSSIGAAASAGCLRAADGDLSVLMSRVPVGTPVVIRR